MIFFLFSLKILCTISEFAGHRFLIFFFSIFSEIWCTNSEFAGHRFVVFFFFFIFSENLVH